MNVSLRGSLALILVFILFFILVVSGNLLRYFWFDRKNIPMNDLYIPLAGEPVSKKFSMPFDGTVKLVVEKTFKYSEFSKMKEFRAFCDVEASKIDKPDMDGTYEWKVKDELVNPETGELTTAGKVKLNLDRDLKRSRCMAIKYYGPTTASLYDHDNLKVESRIYQHGRRTAKFEVRFYKRFEKGEVLRLEIATAEFDRNTSLPSRSFDHKILLKRKKK